MLNSTSLDDLRPLVRVKVRRLIEAAAAQGIQIVIVSTLRDAEAQAALYALGRTTQGPAASLVHEIGSKVTHNAPGDSLHEYGCAIDLFPAIAGHLLTGSRHLEWATWRKLRTIAASPSINLQWGGGSRPDGFVRELWHFHYSAGLSAAELKAGAQLPDVTLGEPSLARASRRRTK
jgi:peptidoglycan L-alanyl-D-glutamate endopeptidase CwlK